MTLIEAWKDSLTLCKPQALKLIFLVTLNAMWQAVRALYTAWFLVPVVALSIASFFTHSIIPGLVAYSFVLASLLLAVRPSTYIKDFAYFKHYYFRLFLFFVEFALWLIVIAVLLIGWEYLFVPFGHTHSMLASNKAFTFTLVNYIATFPAYCINMIIFVIYLFLAIYYAIFFYLDKVGSVFVSGKKALTLLWYNLPMILLYTSIFWGVRISLQYAIASLFAVLFSYVAIPYILYLIFFALLDFVLYLFSFALVSNIYTKRVHDQYSLYQ